MQKCRMWEIYPKRVLVNNIKNQSVLSTAPDVVVAQKCLLIEWTNRDSDAMVLKSFLNYSFVNAYM